MYTKEWNEADECWNILDPEGDLIISISGRWIWVKDQVDGLLSHLNRA